MNDKNYWENFYKNHKKNTSPSAFAEYVAQKYLQSGNTLLELGCGNGRDSFYFASKKNIMVTAIDQVEEEIDFLKSISGKNPNFIAGDFTNLSTFNKVDYLYARFTLHSITEESEDLLLSQLFNKLNDNGLFLAEARSKKDEKEAKFFSTTHYRRYLDFGETIKKIELQGLEIIEKVEAKGFAIYQNEDPYVLRIIARKKS